jgi:hypothetical protein
MKVKRITNDVLFSKAPIMPEDQIEGVLLGYYYRMTRTRDRGPSAGRGGFDQKTGILSSPNALLPKHRAVGGVELALSDGPTPPAAWAAAVIYTDDLPQNVGKPEGQKEWKALFTKPKGDWSDDEVLAVNETTRRVKRVVHRLEERGLFITKPQIDEEAAELGTTHLAEGLDGMTMGWKITYAGIQYAEAFVKEHPQLMRGHTILDALGTTLASQAPQWKQDEIRQSADLHID